MACAATCRKCAFAQAGYCTVSGEPYGKHISEFDCPKGKFKKFADMPAAKLEKRTRALSKPPDNSKAMQDVDAIMTADEDGLYGLLGELGVHRVAKAIGFMSPSGCGGCKDRNRRLAEKYPKLSNTLSVLSKWVKSVKTSAAKTSSM